MHSIAESLYKAYQTPEQLNTLSESGNLSNVVRECVSSVVKTYNGERVRPFSTEIEEVEISILSKLSEALVNFDMQRITEKQEPLDSQVSQLSDTTYKLWEAEHRTKIELSGMTLTLKIDRIDDAYGSFILIDYKTGACSLSDAWGSNPYRPKDPQLAAYAVAMHQQGRKVTDVAYYQLKDGELSASSWFHFVERSRANPKPIELLLNPTEDVSWLTTLEHLANDYLSGHAVADPLNTYDTCRYCHVEPVCRIKCKSDL